MCGIVGFVGAGGEADLLRMTQRIEHRGPDAEGLWADPDQGIWLGHRRLSIVDLEGGDQPMWTEDGAIGVVYNGEIYNCAELRADLEKVGHVFRSDHSDTEVLLHGWREWGEELVPRLNGMWAFALHDRRTQSFFLSRDRFGQKPLFYTEYPGGIAFASELTALIAHERVEARPCSRALRKYFAYGWIPAPLSLYRGIHKLSAGCNLRFGLADRKPEVHRWWSFELEPAPPLPRGSESVWAEELQERLRRAVKRRMLSDVPLGVFLSGGIDSSAVAALAAETLPPGELRTFAVGFDEASFDESRYAEQVARAIGSRHRCRRFSLKDAAAALPEIAGRLDEPVGDPSLLPTHLLCGVARREVKVALGGDGADELFAGYDPFRALRLADAWARWLPRPMHRAVSLVVSQLPTSHRNMSLDFKLKRTLKGLSWPRALWNPVWLGPLCPDELADLFEAPVDVEDVYSEAIAAWEASPAGDLVDRTLQFYTRLYLQDDILVKLDRASMLHGLEVRSPFLDVEVVDLARRLPSDWKLHGGHTKRLLRRAVAGLVPEEILRRPKKGFGMPVGAWLRDGGLPMPEPIAGLGLSAGFHAERVAAHGEGRADHRHYLFDHWLLARAIARDV
jgi:asparagine synthase (glutamine-hydrolysing)